MQIIKESRYCDSVEVEMFLSTYVWKYVEDRLIE
jgi:hypothetical protein